MPTADPLTNTFRAAHDLAKELQHNQVEPLHLLAAALMEDSGVGTEALRRAGITAEKVRDAMQGQGKE
jgi:ATP-dependent Clp protease ATP-binding subunit ClpA